MTKAELVEKLSDEANTTKATTLAILESLTQTITETLKRDEKFVLVGLGNFSIGHRAARQGRNPQTGEPIQIAASNTVKFKATKSLRDAVN